MSFKDKIQLLPRENLQSSHQICSVYPTVFPMLDALMVSPRIPDMRKNQEKTYSK